MNVKKILLKEINEILHFFIIPSNTIGYLKQSLGFYLISVFFMFYYYPYIANLGIVICGFLGSLYLSIFMIKSDWV